MQILERPTYTIPGDVSIVTLMSPDEKPLFFKDANEIIKLQDLAIKNKVILYTAYNHRFEPHFINMKSISKYHQRHELQDDSDIKAEIRNAKENIGDSKEKKSKVQ